MFELSWCWNVGVGMFERRCWNEAGVGMKLELPIGVGMKVEDKSHHSVSSHFMC